MDFFLLKTSKLNVIIFDVHDAIDNKMYNNRNCRWILITEHTKGFYNM